MALVQNTFEGGTTGTAITTTNSGGTSGQAFDSVTQDSASTWEFSGARAAHGALSLHLLTGTTKSSPYVAWTGEIGATTAYGRVYLYLPANPPANTNILRFYSAGTIVGTVRVETNGVIGALYGTSTFAGRTTNPAPLNAWCRIEWSLTNSTIGTGSITVKLFNDPDSTTPTETITFGSISTGSAANIDQFRVGFITSVTSTEMWFDDLAWSDAGWIGPAGGGAQRNIAASDAVAVSAAGVRLTTTSRSIAGAVAAADSPTRSTSANRPVSESVGVGGVTTRSTGFAVAAADGATLADSGARAAQASRPAASAVTATVAAARTMTVSRPPASAATITDNTVAGRATTASTVDAMQLAGSATVVFTPAGTAVAGDHYVTITMPTTSITLTPSQSYITMTGPPPEIRRSA